MVSDRCDGLSTDSGNEKEQSRRSDVHLNGIDIDVWLATDVTAFLLSPATRSNKHEDTR
jgi:hypothetical protein